MKLLVTLLSIATLHACGGEVTPTPMASPAPARVAADGATRAVVRLVRIDEEASNLGGTHFTFELDGPGAPRFVHGGGHGFSLPDRDLGRVPSDFYVAEIVPSPRPFRVWDGGWGLGGLPAYVGTVRRALAVDGRGEAVGLLPIGIDSQDRVPVDFVKRDD